MVAATGLALNREVENQMKARITGIIVTCCLVAGTGAAIVPASASAGAYNWGAKNLPGGVWDGSGAVEANEYYESANAETTSTVCIGPVQKSGGGYTAPYGWKCNPGRLVQWEHTALTAESGVYNPNSGTISSFSAYEQW